jgi:hypothetical protein
VVTDRAATLLAVVNALMPGAFSAPTGVATGGHAFSLTAEVRADQQVAGLAPSLAPAPARAYHKVVSVQTRLVLATLCVFNGVVLIALGFGSAVFVDGAVRLALAGALWVAAVCLFVLARRLRQGVEWR